MHLTHLSKEFSFRSLHQRWNRATNNEMWIIENCIEEATSWQKSFKINDELHEALTITNNLLIDRTCFGNWFQNVKELDHHVLKENLVSTSDLAVYIDLPAGNDVPIPVSLSFQVCHVFAIFSRTFSTLALSWVLDLFASVEDTTTLKVKLIS